MTDHLPPEGDPPPAASSLDGEQLDLLASDLLDGDDRALAELDAASRQQVEHRADELRSAIAALRTPVGGPADDVRDRQVATAIASRPATPSAMAASPVGATRRARSGHATRIALAVAATLAVVFGAWVLLRSTPRSTETASMAGRADSSTPTHGPATASSTTGKRVLVPAAAAPTATSLGAAATPGALATLARQRIATFGSQNAPETQSATRSAAALAARCRPFSSAAGDVVLDTDAVYRGADVEVVVVRGGASGAPEHLYAFTPDTCRVVVDRPL
jgi:hypothetical protein